MDTLLNDVRYGVRMLLKSPGFAAVAVLALALGSGATTAIFSVVHAVLLRPLPYAEPERLVIVWDNFLRQGIRETRVSAPEFREYRERVKSFEGTAAFTLSRVNLTGGELPERLATLAVSPNLLRLLGVRPQRGRSFLDEEETPGRDRVALVAHALWQERFGGEEGIIGRPLILDGQPYTVVGVLPPDFQFPPIGPGLGEVLARPQIWIPLSLSAERLQDRGSRFLGLVARLRAGASPAEAGSEMAGLAERLREENPESYRPDTGWTIIVRPLTEQVVGGIRPALLVLAGAVGCVALIACANVASLLLARAAAREREIAVRTALGARRLRLVRQLLTESLILGLLGGAFGLLLALWGIDLLVALGPTELPRLPEVRLDGAVLLFTLAVSLVTGLLAGAVPALHAARRDLTDSLREGGRGATAGRRRSRIRAFLVVAEIALAVILLTGAGLLMRSFLRLRRVDPGFDTANLLTLGISLPTDRYATQADVNRFWAELLLRAAALPGGRGAALTGLLPFSGGGSDWSFAVEGKTLNPIPDEQWRPVSPAYSSTLGIPVLRGRAFDDHDDAGSRAVVLISEGLARRYWPGEDPIGRRIQMGPNPRQPWRTVVGVVGDVREFGLDAPPPPEYYVPQAQAPGMRSEMSLVVRAAVDPRSLDADLRRVVAGLDPDLPVSEVETMEARLGASLAQRAFSVVLLGLFAVVALILAAIGIYGVMAYSVAQRTHEVGIRMALGARRADVLRLVVGQGLLMALLGVASGIGAGFLLTRLMAGLVYDVSLADPITYAGVSALLVGVALLASYLPARRAARLDPMIALTVE